MSDNPITALTEPLTRAEIEEAQEKHARLVEAKGLIDVGLYVAAPLLLDFMEQRRLRLAAGWEDEREFRADPDVKVLIAMLIGRTMSLDNETNWFRLLRLLRQDRDLRAKSDEFFLLEHVDAKGIQYFTDGWRAKAFEALLKQDLSPARTAERALTIVNAATPKEAGLTRDGKPLPPQGDEDEEEPKSFQPVTRYRNRRLYADDVCIFEMVDESEVAWRFVSQFLHIAGGVAYVLRGTDVYAVWTDNGSQRRRKIATLPHAPDREDPLWQFFADRLRLKLDSI